MKKTSNTVILVEAALMIALSTVLGMLKIFEMPFGGSVTCGSMVPIVLLSFRRGPKWGLVAGFAESLLQMLLKFDAPPAKTFLAFFMVILLDYVIAYTIIGAASLFGKPFANRSISVIVGAVGVSFLRFLCSFFSGILVWAPYAPENMPVWEYSMKYNGAYMLPEAILTAVLAVILVRVFDKIDGRTSVHA